MNDNPPMLPRLSRASALALLEQHEIVITEQRLEIARLLFAQNQHLSAEQLLAKLSAQPGAASKATVYNTLKLFAETGLLREVVVDAAKRFYDSNLEPHHHLFHTDTGLLEDVAPVRVEFPSAFGIPSEKEILGVDVIIRIGPKSDPT